MIDWLKNKFGDAWTDEIDEEARKELAKWGVPKADFNAKGKKVSEYERTVQTLTQELETLKNSGTDAAALQKQLDDQKKDFDQQIAQMQLGFAVRTALKDAGARNVETVLPLLQNFLKDAKFAEDGTTVDGLADQIKHLTEDQSTAFLFDTKPAGHQVAGAHPASPGNKTGGKIDEETMTYSQMIAASQE